MRSLVDRVPICILRYVFEFLEAHDALHNWGLCKQWRNDSRRNGEEQLLWATLLSRDAPVPLRRLLDELRKAPDSEPRSCIPRSLIKRTTDPQTGILDIRRLYYALLYNTVVYDVVQSQYFRFFEHAAPGREIALCILLATHSYGFVQVPSQVFAIDEEYSLRAWCDPFIQMDAQVTGWQTPAAIVAAQPTPPSDAADCLGFAIKQLHVRYLDLSGYTSALPSDSHVPRTFLDGCASLTSIDFGASTVPSITVGYRFCALCTNLISIDVSCVAGLTTIPQGFLSYCPSLRSFDFSPLANVRVIENFVLRACTSLSEVTIDGLYLLEVIGEGFLMACSKLPSISLSQPTQRVRRVGQRFLAGCSKLQSAQLGALANLDVIADDFMRACEGVSSVLGFSQMSRVRCVGDNFLENCCSLVEVELFDPRSSIDVIGEGFLASCRSLRSVDLSCLHATRFVGKYFLAHCTSLTSVDFSCLRSLQRISVGCLSGCRALTIVSLRGCSNLEHIDQRFLANCHSLTSVDLSGLAELNFLGADFLVGCVRLAEVKLVGLESLETIRLDLHRKFLQGLTNLQWVVIDDRCTPVLRSAVRHLGDVVVRERVVEEAPWQ